MQPVMRLRKILISKQALVILSAVLLLAVFIYKDSRLPPPMDEVSTTIAKELAAVQQHEPATFDQVKTVLDHRCVVCHGCYDAPCQLKLSSNEGLQRGASEKLVYDARLTAVQPTRLFVDAKSTAEWRSHGFTSVLNEAQPSPENNLKNSVLYHLLQLKQQHPQPESKQLPDSFSLELNREQTCPTLDTVSKFSRKHRLWGMPYAMPNLQPQEYRTLVSWLSQGAPAPAPPAPTTEVQAEIDQWELFLNRSSNKQQLVSRYLYEHLYHAHIHFANSPAREFYRLVRSTTPSGQAINEIPTVRPYDDPGTAPFYYRLLRYHPSIVVKNHIVYEFSEQRMQRYQKLFLDPEYDVQTLPSYRPEIATNPFKVFAAIPTNSRYRFMLDDAHFFIEGFIKGPVCRGQIALNVIEDNFWVLFFDPDQGIFTNDADFINSTADDLQIPADRPGSHDLLDIWTGYWQQQRRYMERKQARFEKLSSHDIDHAMSYIWNGDGKNPNAALTVFRHFDSGSVAYGLVGDNPETTWVLDYPLLERIHYLLVASFNVYGNVVHQLSTRIYMDFLRMEGEDQFLAFLPVSKRKAIRDTWYIGQREKVEAVFPAPKDWLKVESVSGYKTDNPQQELYQLIKKRLAVVAPRADAMNHCGRDECKQSSSDIARSRVDLAMNEIVQMQGAKLHPFPDVAFVRIRMEDPELDMAYSLIRNKAYKNVTSFLSDAHERDRSDIEKDSMTVVDWLEGSYPNFFFSVAISEIEDFTRLNAAIRNTDDYEKFVDRFGVRRTNPEFWALADWFQAHYKKNKPILSGLFDLNRIHNR